MGFWHTGYFEFKDEGGIEPQFQPGPLIHKCTKCDAIFDNSHDLQNHLFSEHPVLRPILYLSNREVGGSELLVSSPLLIENVTFNQCEDVEINGSCFVPSDAAKYLSQAPNGIYDLKLRNKSLSTNVRLNLSVPTTEDLLAIEKEFKTLTFEKRLDREAIETFISSCKQYESAQIYMDGICEYLYGTKEKEGVMDSFSNSGYVERYNKALIKLEGIDRPLARLICALIYFHYNQFNAVCLLIPKTRLGKVAEFFYRTLLDEPVNYLNVSCEKSYDNILTDLACEEVIQTLCLMKKSPTDAINNAENQLAKDYLDVDRVKFHILIVEAAKVTHNSRLIRLHSGYLRDNPDFRDWAMAAKALT